jgi:hypothetical protein
VAPNDQPDEREIPMTSSTTATGPQTLTAERADLLESLAAQRFFLRNTLRDLTDEQAALTPTASELCLGGLVKHVAHVERQWAAFVVEGPSAMTADDPAEQYAEYAANFAMAPGDTVDTVLALYADAAAATDRLVRELPDLDLAHPLPEAPWFEKGATRSARRVFFHIIGETAQHAGHADIIRETIDGAKSMG